MYACWYFIQNIIIFVQSQDCVNYPLKGWTTISVNSPYSTVTIANDDDPSNSDIYKRPSDASVQYNLRDTQSTAIPEGYDTSILTRTLCKEP